MSGGQPLIDGPWVRAAVAQYEQPLISYAAHILGNADQARDVVQDTFIRLCTHDRKEIDDHLAEWLYTVCRNRALDVKRKEKRMRLFAEDQMATVRSRQAGPEQVTENKDSADKILRMIRFLPDNQREVIRLKFQHGMSYQQISRITNLSVTNVGFLIHTGLKRVREQMVCG